MLSWKNSLLLVLLAVTALGQTASRKPTVDVLRVAHRLACRCGCTDTVATCSMLECHFSKPAKERIAKMQAAGMSDQAIIDQFIAEYGPDIYRAMPNAWGRAVPYASLALGLAAICLLIRRYYRKPALQTASAPDDPALARYRQQIENDLSHLD